MKVSIVCAYCGISEVFFGLTHFLPVTADGPGVFSPTDPSFNVMANCSRLGCNTRIISSINC